MASERETLLLGVLNQLDLSGKIDYKMLARDIGAPTPGAAQVRWSRFRSKLRSSAGTSPTKSVGVQKARSSSKMAKGVKKGAKKESGEEEGRADDELDELPETPVRKTPARKARAVAFKDEWSDDEEEKAAEKARCEEVLRMMEGVEEEVGSSANQSSGSTN